MKTAGFLTIVFGLVTAAVGVWRHVEAGGNPQALWFGVTMGAVALAGGLLLLRGWRRTGLLVAAVALAFVGGWFIRRVFIGHEEGLSPRIVTILAACAVEAVVLVWTLARRKAAASDSR
jgi:hypothetical protein